jgi:hypothetical protein
MCVCVCKRVVEKKIKDKEDVMAAEATDRLQVVAEGSRLSREINILFDAIDTEHRGKITPDALHVFLQGLGRGASP